MNLETVTPRWRGETVVVAAPGPSLSVEVAGQCRGARTIAVQDAYRLMPWADVLYGCDAKWWDVHKGCPAFAGERWSSHDDATNAKIDAAKAYGLRLIAGEGGDEFSTDPALIRYAGNSGFQAVNLALHFGARRIVLVGFDMRGTHYFGSHPKPLTNPTGFDAFIRAFTKAALFLPAGVSIVNATPGSALRCFPVVDLAEVLGERIEAAA